MENENVTCPSSKESTQSESQYFFFLAECKGNQYPASFIGQPIPVTKSVAQLFISASAGSVSSPSQQEQLFPLKNDVNTCEFENSDQLPITSANLKLPPNSSAEKKNSIVSLMEALIKTPKPKNNNSIKVNSHQEKYSYKIPEMYSHNQQQHHPATESEAFKTFLPFRPSEHMNIFGTPFTVPSLEDDMNVDDDKNESENEEESTSGFESDDEKLETSFNRNRQESNNDKDSSRRSGKFSTENDTTGIASTGYKEKRRNMKTCEHRKNCRQNSKSKDGNNPYFNLARIFSSSRARKRQKGKR